MSLAELFDANKARAHDPTRTEKLRGSFRAAADLRLRQLRALLRIAIVEHNILGLSGGQQMMLMAPSHRLQQFAHWFEAEARNVLAGHWADEYISRAYASGHTRAQKEVGRAVEPHADRLRHLQMLGARELVGIASAAVQKITREAHDDQARKRLPSTAFRRQAKILQKTAHDRLKAFANVMTVKAHNDAKLWVYRSVGVTHVGIDPELRTAKPLKVRDAPPEDWYAEAGGEELVNWVTAEDDKVCPECEDWSDGSPYSLDDVEGRIPLHINCRCSVVPYFTYEGVGRTWGLGIDHALDARGRFIQGEHGRFAGSEKGTVEAKVVRAFHGGQAAHGGAAILARMAEGQPMFFSTERDVAESYAREPSRQIKGGGAQVTSVAINTAHYASRDQYAAILERVKPNWLDYHTSEAAALDDPKVAAAVRAAGFKGVVGAWDFGFRSDFDEVQVIAALDPATVHVESQFAGSETWSSVGTAPTEGGEPTDYTDQVDALRAEMERSGGFGIADFDRTQRQALDKYVHGGYDDMNKEARTGLDTVEGGALDRAIKEFELPREMTVYRHVGWHNLSEKLLNHVGKEFTEPGFMSTTIDNTTSGGPIFKRGSYVEIKVPAGANALPVGSMSPHPEEAEVLFPRGARMRLTRAEPLEGMPKTYKFTAELVRQ